MHMTAVVLQILLGIGFLMFGFTKFGAKQQVETFKQFGYPQWFRVVTGLVEIVGAAGMIAGIWNPVLAALAGLLIGVTMLGATITHIRSKDPAKDIGAPILFLFLAVVVTVLNL